MFYISFMVATEEKHTADSQKMKRRESKHTVKENLQFTKEDNKREKNEQGNCKVARK